MTAAKTVGDGVDLWIDTRDARDIHRATRYCHHFRVRLSAQAGGSPAIRIERPPINRSLASPPTLDARSVQASASLDRAGWTLVLLFSAKTLNGFDPEINRRFGFAYEVHDALRGAESMPVGRDFPLAEDPSLWCTLELVDSPPADAHSSQPLDAEENQQKPATTRKTRRTPRSPRGMNSDEA